MNAEENRMLTTEQAMKRLGMSRATFYNRIKKHNIKPIGYNENLERQPNPRWRLEDINKIGKPFDPTIIGDPIGSVA